MPSSERDRSLSEAFVVLDVGGTSFTAAVVVDDEVTEPVVRGASRQDASADALLTTFAEAIVKAVGDRSVEAAVVAIPAPFEYAAGVSRMEHKFAALLGIDVGAEMRRSTRLDVVFVNDAEAAAVGAWIELGRPDTDVATVTLGTGVGSGLVVGGAVAGHNELWRAPYRDGIVEDVVSSRALADGYARRTGRHRTVAEIGASADDGDESAIETFAEYGTHLGAALVSYFDDVAPTTIVVAGGITGAWHHVERVATAVYVAAGGTATLIRSELPEPALLGGAELTRRSEGKRGEES